MQRTSRNLYLSTPNKLFECLAAGTPVVVSDFPAMRRIVLDDPFGPLGTVCNPSLVPDIARALRDILEIAPSAKDELRRRCSAAARCPMELGNGSDNARRRISAARLSARANALRAPGQVRVRASTCSGTCAASRASFGLTVARSTARR